METKLCYSNTHKQNSESFSNFTPLFLLSLSKICIIAYFILPSEYSNLNLLLHAHSYVNVTAISFVGVNWIELAVIHPKAIHLVGGTLKTVSTSPVTLFYEISCTRCTFIFMVHKVIAILALVNYVSKYYTCLLFLSQHVAGPFLWILLGQNCYLLIKLSQREY